MPATLRPLAAPDATPARALATGVLGDAPYADSLRASLESAMRSASDEHRAIVAHDGDMLVGLAVFGETAGALGAGRIHLVAVDPSARRNGLGMALTQAACADLRARRARFVVIELPEEPRLVSALRLARRAGFYQEGRVSDYVRDGVGLLVLRRDLGDS